MYSAGGWVIPLASTPTSPGRPGPHRSTATLGTGTAPTKTSLPAPTVVLVSRFVMRVAFCVLLQFHTDLACLIAVETWRPAC